MYNIDMNETFERPENPLSKREMALLIMWVQENVVQSSEMDNLSYEEIVLEAEDAKMDGDLDIESPIVAADINDALHERSRIINYAQPSAK